MHGQENVKQTGTNVMYNFSNDV